MMPSISPEYGWLLCPECGSHNLHQTATNVFDRPYEDAEIGSVISVDHETGEVHASTRSKLKGSPSSRRQGMTVVFSCESCPVASVLEIYQDKGSTYIKWRRT